MVNITLHNLSGLFMGPVAQIASMFVIEANDNFVTSQLLEEALNHVETDTPYEQSETPVQTAVMEDASEWLYPKNDKPSYLKLLSSEDE